MNTDLLIALGSSIVSFFAFRLLFSFLNKILNIEIPDTIGFLIGIIIIVVLYIKKDFFFSGNALVMGITIGAILSLLWNIKDTGFMSEVLRVIISFRFLLWCIAIAAGAYWDSAMLGLWNKYIIFGAIPVRLISSIAVVILLVFGTILTLFPKFYIRNALKSPGFTFNKRVPTAKKVLTQTAGLIIVFLFSGLLTEAISVIVNILS